MATSTTNLLATNRLNAFSASYQSTNEDIALHSRGEFLAEFPLRRLQNLRLDDYVIGHGAPTFCAYVEAKTRAWAHIYGANSFKFGIYFGRIKSDPTKKYRFAAKFGENQSDAFKGVKSALLSLVKEGSRKGAINFQAIDENPLSQMFKAKILSLYFPERFINVCSGDDIKDLAKALRIPPAQYTSEYQHQLAVAKAQHPVVRDWSYPKFTEFLYATYLKPSTAAPSIKKPREKVNRKVNFEDIQAQRDAIGKAAEEFALSWEQERLGGDSRLVHLIRKIKDLRDRPGYGYDFQSFTLPNVKRYVEVKAIGKIGGGYRFFLSSNEQIVSQSREHKSEYYFYLVSFDGKGNPLELTPILASELYAVAGLQPASYVVQFDLK